MRIAVCAGILTPRRFAMLTVDEGGKGYSLRTLVNQPSVVAPAEHGGNVSQVSVSKKSSCSVVANDVHEVGELVSRRDPRELFSTYTHTEAELLHHTCEGTEWPFQVNDVRWHVVCVLMVEQGLLLD